MVVRKQAYLIHTKENVPNACDQPYQANNKSTEKGFVV